MDKSIKEKYMNLMAISSFGDDGSTIKKSFCSCFLNSSEV